MRHDDKVLHLAFQSKFEQAYELPSSQCLVTGGGGPKADLLKEMIAEEGLESRVEMVGPVPHEKARDLLVSLLVMLPVWCAFIAVWCAGIVSSAYLLLHITLSSCQLTGNRGAH